MKLDDIVIGEMYWYKKETSRSGYDFITCEHIVYKDGGYYVLESYGESCITEGGDERIDVVHTLVPISEIYESREELKATK